MNQQTGVTLEHLWDGLDESTDVACTIRLRFISDEFISPRLSETVKQKLFEDIAPILQEAAERRFGKGLFKVKCAGVKNGSLEIWLTLVSIGGALYTFFKDYEDLRKGVLLFVDDIRAIGPQLLEVSRQSYNKSAAKLRRSSQTKHRGTVSH